MVDTIADQLLTIGLISAKRIEIVLIMFLQWLLGTGSVNTTARSDASYAMHTDQVNTLPIIPSPGQSGFIFFSLLLSDFK